MDISQLFTVHSITGALVSGFLLGIAPYVFAFFVDVEPEKLPATVRELIARYVWGTSSLLIGFAVLPDGERTMVKILFITVVGGGVVVLRYISDHFQTMTRQHRMMHKNDKDLNPPGGYGA